MTDSFRTLRARVKSFFRTQVVVPDWDTDGRGLEVPVEGAIEALKEYEEALGRPASGSVLVFVRHAILAWRDSPKSVEDWEALAQHITEWVDDRRTLREFRGRDVLDALKRDGLPLVEHEGKVYGIPATAESQRRLREGYQSALATVAYRDRFSEPYNWGALWRRARAWLAARGKA
jgi:hypothetical protein